MRIAQVAPPWLAVPPAGYGGIEQIVGLLAKGLQQRGHQVTLFAPEGSRSQATVVSPLPPAGPAQIGDVWFEAQHTTAAYLDRREFDVIHDHTLLGTALAAVRGGPPVVHTLHGP